nr:PEP-CTERM sorting domain-containing protein [Armatimonas sp.]
MTRTRFSRRGFSLSILSLLVGIALSPGARAQSLTTLFGSNNGNAIGGMVFFDLNVSAGKNITVTSIDTNVNTVDGIPPIAVGSVIQVDVYIRTGTASGFEGNSAGWTKVSSGTGLAAVVNTHTSIDISDFLIGSGITGVGLHNVTYRAGYTNGTGVNEFYSNADLSLTARSATGTSFTGGAVSSPRVWNGEIFYTVITGAPEPGTLALVALGMIGGIVARRRK